MKKHEEKAKEDIEKTDAQTIQTKGEKKTDAQTIQTKGKKKTNALFSQMQRYIKKNDLKVLSTLTKETLLEEFIKPLGKIAENTITSLLKEYDKYTKEANKNHHDIISFDLYLKVFLSLNYIINYKYFMIIPLH